MNPENIVCEVCGTVVEKNKYERHIKFGHKEKRENKCHLCHKDFTSKFSKQFKNNLLRLKYFTFQACTIFSITSLITLTLETIFATNARGLTTRQQILRNTRGYTRSSEIRTAAQSAVCSSKSEASSTRTCEFIKRRHQKDQRNVRSAKSCLSAYRVTTGLFIWACELMSAVSATNRLARNRDWIDTR